MKKVLSMIAALLLCVGTQAQIVSSRSAIVKTEKQASSTQWFLRAAFRQHRRILGNGIWTRLPWFQSGRHEVHGS